MHDDERDKSNKARGRRVVSCSFLLSFSSYYSFHTHHLNKKEKVYFYPLKYCNSVVLIPYVSFGTNQSLN
jgi:hypothetical protein